MGVSTLARSDYERQPDPLRRAMPSALSVMPSDISTLPATILIRRIVAALYRRQIGLGQAAAHRFPAGHRIVAFLAPPWEKARQRPRGICGLSGEASLSLRIFHAM